MRLLVVLCLGLGVANAAPPTLDQILDGVGPLSASRADPQAIARAVNRLQPMGRDAGVAALRRYLKARKAPPPGIFLVMRALMPGKTRPPGLGMPFPAPTENEAQHLPNFPLLILDDVPLSVVDGYALGGLPEPARMYLDRLAALKSWRKAPLQPRPVGAVLATLPHFGLFTGKHPTLRLIHRQLQRMDGPPPKSSARFHIAKTAGEPLVTVQGGRLPKPVTVPLWLSVDQPDPDGECPGQHETVLMMRPDGTLYVEQYNSACKTRGSGCKLYDPWADAWRALGQCIDPGYGKHRRAIALGETWVHASGDADERSGGRLVRWDPDKGQTSVVDLVDGETPRWILGTIWMRSDRPLAGPGNGSRWYYWSRGWQLASAESAWWIGSF